MLSNCNSRIISRYVIGLKILRELTDGHDL